MSSLLTIPRSGTYYRVADPDWDEPLDGRYSQQTGGRWNRPDSFAVVYLNDSENVARANVFRKLEDHPYGPEDLRDDNGPILVATAVDREEFADIVTNAGCTAAGLPVSYPQDEDGSLIPHARCWSVGDAANEQALPGIACRSAATPPTDDGEELAWFERAGRLIPKGMRRFSEWFWSPPPSVTRGSPLPPPPS